MNDHDDEEYDRGMEALGWIIVACVVCYSLAAIVVFGWLGWRP